MVKKKVINNFCDFYEIDKSKKKFAYLIFSSKNKAKFFFSKMPVLIELFNNSAPHITANFLELS